MKKLLLLVSVLFVWGCSDERQYHAPAPKPTETGADLPQITLEFPLEEWNKLLANYDLNPKNEKKIVSHFTYTFQGQTVQLDSIGLKLKGNTSRRRPESQTGTGPQHNAVGTQWNHCHFNLDFSKNRDDQRFEGVNKLSLKWFKDDPDYVREMYCYDLFARYGVWTAPQARYCRLTIKVQGDAQPAYYGVYLMIEAVDEDFIAKRQAEWTSNVGFLWKGGYGSDGLNANFVQTTSMGVENVKMVPSQSVYYAYDLKTREDELGAGKAELTQFITDLNTKTGTEFKDWISQKMDIPLFLKTYAVNVLVGMWDDYWVNGNNFYFYFGGNGKAYFIPYDYDNTLGTSEILANSGTQNPLFWGPMGNRPLVTKILAIPEYQMLYRNYIDELIASDDLFAADGSMARILQWQQGIRPYVPNDTAEDMGIYDQPADWGNQSNYRLLSGNTEGGANGEANWFGSRIGSIPWQ